MSDISPIDVELAANVMHFKPKVADSERPAGAIDAMHNGDESVAAEYSEIALADEFVETHGEVLRYVPPWNKWFVWRDGCWIEDVRLAVFNMARVIVANASEALDTGKAGSGKSVAQAKTVWAVERLARSYPLIAAGVEQWDRDPMLLNTPGGVVDLRTGETFEHDPMLYCSKMTAVAPDALVPANCLWLQFIHRIFDGNGDLVSFVQRACGYSLTGSTKEEVLFFGYGTGQNGKSKLTGTVSGIMGGYHESAAMETFVASKYDQHPADLAKLRGARLVTASETEEGRRWSESKIKAITGGDTISARFMRQDFFDFRPQLKLWAVGNHKPGIRNVDFAMRRRLNLIPFTVTIPEHERDRNLEEKLRAEWPIILRWMIDGCLEWQQKGLQPPSAVTEATDAYMAGEDVVRLWLDERCDVGREHRDSFGALWASWKDWAERAGEFASTKKRFGQTLQERGFHPEHERAGRFYSGLSVRAL